MSAFVYTGSPTRQTSPPSHCACASLQRKFKVVLILHYCSAEFKSQITVLIIHVLNLCNAVGKRLERVPRACLYSACSSRSSPEVRKLLFNIHFLLHISFSQRSKLLQPFSCAQSSEKLTVTNSSSQPYEIVSNFVLNGRVCTEKVIKQQRVRALTAFAYTLQLITVNYKYRQVCVSSYAQMPGFELEQVDGGSPIELPFGETVLGRGPFLGVSGLLVLCTVFSLICLKYILNSMLMLFPLCKFSSCN